MIKNGKTPVSKKPKVGPSFEDADVFGNALHMPEIFKKTLSEHGFDVRWLDFIGIKNLGGYHRRGWKVFDIKDFQEIRDTLNVDGILDGLTPDGTIRRGDSVLGIRTKTLSDKHRKVVKSRTEAQSGLAKRAAEEMRESAKRNNINTTVKEGYED